MSNLIGPSGLLYSGKGFRISDPNQLTDAEEKDRLDRVRFAMDGILSEDKIGVCLRRMGSVELSIVAGLVTGSVGAFTISEQSKNAVRVLLIGE